MSTQRQIASLANVSLGTVSRFFNGELLKLDTQIKLRKAIVQLGDTIPKLAQGRNIAIISTNFSNTFVAGLLDKVLKNLSNKDFNVMLFTTIDDSENTIEKLVRLKIAGLIVNSFDINLNSYDKFKELGIPVVLFDCGKEALSCDQIMIDNINSSYNAVKYLIAKKHKKIAIINPNKGDTLAQRQVGYEKALKDSDISLNKDYIKNVSFNKNDVTIAVNELLALKNKPEAIFTTNLFTTMQTIEALNKMGVNIPKEISLFGFDDSNELSCLGQQVTTIVQSSEQYANAIVDILIKRINGDFSDYPLATKIKTTIIDGITVEEKI